MIYHTLGMECLSPFKNLYLEDADYLKLLKNLKYYLNCKLEFKEYAIEIHSKETYPVMCLHDITVHCNHSKTHEDAISNWERRVKKINWDNIFIEMYTESSFFAHEFSKLDHFQKKICFVPFEIHDESQMQLKTLREGQEFYQVVNDNAGNSGLTYFPWELLELSRNYRYIC